MIGNKMLFKKNPNTLGRDQRLIESMNDKIAFMVLVEFIEDSFIRPPDIPAVTKRISQRFIIKNKQGESFRFVFRFP